MLTILVLLPIFACVAIALGSPARMTAVIAAVLNLAFGLYAALNWQDANLNFDMLVLAKPSLHLSLGFIDGMSVVMTLLAVIVTLAAVLSGKAPDEHQRLWYISSLLIAAGAIGAFISTDLFFFYAFHELALLPTFLMIGLLGRGERRQIAWKITIYLGVGSMVLLAGLVWLAISCGTYNIPAILANPNIPASTQKGIAALLIVGFGTLVSLFPFHSWAAPAYASAPAPVAMLHAGVLKKFGLYGLLRIAVPMLPLGMQAWLTPLLVLLLCNIIWVGFVTISQKRLDLMLGSSSVMHMGYIFLAIAALVAVGGDNSLNSIALPAAALLMFAHGVSIALQFSLADQIQRSTGSLDLYELGGLAKPMPTLAFLFGIGGMASIGLPGLSNFAGELLVFISSFKNYAPEKGLGPVQIACIVAIWGVVISAVYMLRALRRIFHGGTVLRTKSVSDMTVAECIPAALLVVVMFAVGICPNLLLQFLK